MMTRQQIRQFLAIVDAGSFTRAAENMGVSQPSISSGVRKLENYVGVRLFEREKAAVRLTSAGNRLLPVARRIELEFRKAEVESNKAPRKGSSFVLGVVPSFSTRMLETFCRRHGESRLVVREKDQASLMRELRLGRVGAAVLTAGASVSEGHEWIPLYSEPYRLMVPDGHSLASRDMLTAEELSDEVMIARRSCEALSYTSGFFTNRGIRPQFSFKSMNDDRAMAMVAAGLGLTVAPHSLLRPGVKSIELAEFDAVRQIGLAARRDDYAASGPYRRMVETIAAHLRDACRGKADIIDKLD